VKPTEIGIRVTTGRQDPEANMGDSPGKAKGEKKGGNGEKNWRRGWVIGEGIV